MSKFLLVLVAMQMVATVYLFSSLKSVETELKSLKASSISQLPPAGSASLGRQTVLVGGLKTSVMQLRRDVRGVVQDVFDNLKLDDQQKKKMISLGNKTSQKIHDLGLKKMSQKIYSEEMTKIFNFVDSQAKVFLSESDFLKYQKIIARHRSGYQ